MIRKTKDILLVKSFTSYTEKCEMYNIQNQDPKI